MIEISNIERQNELGRLFERTGRLSISQICEKYGISEATARRDLDALAETGRIRRVHGGAILVRRATPEEPILARSHEMSVEKGRIGQVAAALINDGETIFLGSGTTVFEVARNLAERTLTVITNSLPVINFMAEKTNITLIALGGSLRASELSFIGHITEQSLAELHVDRVIIGTRAISIEQGLTNDFLPETLTDRATLNIGREIVVVADHTKCGVISTTFLAPLNVMHTLVTDNGVDNEFINALKLKKINVILA
jgi:DeoR/GlpR family transcriptional regulator of sugar metabolism